MIARRCSEGVAVRALPSEAVSGNRGVPGLSVRENQPHAKMMCNPLKGRES